MAKVRATVTGRGRITGGDPTLVIEPRRYGVLPIPSIGCVECGEPIPALCAFCAAKEQHG